MTKLNPLGRQEDRRFYVTIYGSGIRVTGWLPELPRKGDILHLRSLCKYDDTLPNDVIVSKVEWALEQAANFFHYSITVRRTKPS